MKIFLILIFLSNLVCFSQAKLLFPSEIPFADFLELNPFALWKDSTPPKSIIYTSTNSTFINDIHGFNRQGIPNFYGKTKVKRKDETYYVIKKESKDTVFYVKYSKNDTQNIKTVFEYGDKVSCLYLKKHTSRIDSLIRYDKGIKKKSFSFRYLTDSIFIKVKNYNLDTNVFEALKKKLPRFASMNYADYSKSAWYKMIVVKNNDSITVFNRNNLNYYKKYWVRNNKYILIEEVYSLMGDTRKKKITTDIFSTPNKDSIVYYGDNTYISNKACSVYYWDDKGSLSKKMGIYDNFDNDTYYWRDRKGNIIKTEYYYKKELYDTEFTSYKYYMFTFFSHRNRIKRKYNIKYPQSFL